MKVNLQVVQSCPTLCNPMDYSPSGLSVRGDSPGQNTGVGSCFLLQGIFPTRVSRIAGGFFTVWATRKVIREIMYMYSLSLSFNMGGFPGGASSKEPAWQFRKRKRCGLDPWVVKIP